MWPVNALRGLPDTLRLETKFLQRQVVLIRISQSVLLLIYFLTPKLWKHYRYYYTVHEVGKENTEHDMFYKKHSLKGAIFFTNRAPSICVERSFPFRTKIILDNSEQNAESQRRRKAFRMLYLFRRCKFIAADACSD